MTTLARPLPPVKAISPSRNPRDSWPAWADADTWELGPDRPDQVEQAPAGHSGLDAEGPRPTAGFGHAPDPWTEAFWAGYCLGLEREDAAAPGRYTASEARAFLAGHIAGGREWERRLDEMFADRTCDGRITDADAWPLGCVS